MNATDIIMKSNPQREEVLFQAAAQLTGAERTAFLGAACHGNAVLRERLDLLLAAHEAEDSVLEAMPPPHPGRKPVATMKLELSDAPDEAMGQTLGRYKLLERVGEGGCGVVYVAEQTEPVRRRVALKVIKLGMDTRQVVARFEAERQAMAAEASATVQREKAEAERSHAQQETQRADAQARNAVENREHSRRLLYAADMNLACQAVKKDNLGRARRLLDRHRPAPMVDSSAIGA